MRNNEKQYTIIIHNAYKHYKYLTVRQQTAEKLLSLLSNVKHMGQEYCRLYRNNCVREKA